MASCIPFAHGVPFAGGPPIWWDNTSGPKPELNKRIDDPRWAGALARTYPDAGTGVPTEHVLFRALHHTDAGRNYLYLSWWIQVDPTIQALGDLIMVGFRKSPGGTPYVIKLEAYSSSPGPLTGPTAIPNPRITVYEAVPDTATSFSLATRPDRAWISEKAFSWTHGANNQWALNMRVPMSTSSGAIDDTGIDLGTVFKMWYQVVVDAGNAGALPFTWPRNKPAADELSCPPPDEWGDFKIGAVANDPDCEKGVWIDWSRIGTTNPVPHEIRWSRTPPGITNTFFARPRNDGSAPTAGAVNARFRLANWGSQPNPNQVTNPDTLWTDILPGGNAVAGAVIPANSDGNIQFNWKMTEGAPAVPTPSQPNIDEFDPPGPTKKWAHQCMLVELSGPGVNFERASVFRNMDSVQASVFERKATISVKGLPAVAGQAAQEVYLFLQSLNMPEVIEGGSSPGDPKPPQREGGGAPPPPPAGAVTHVPTAPTPEVEPEPMQLVHCYHWTGDVRPDGKHVLRPQTSFGVIPSHDGELHGWDSEIVAEGGAQLEEIHPNFYRVRDGIPVDGSIEITQRIVAWEQPRGPGCGPLAAIIRFFRKLFGGSNP
jgi:hypothetical protein